MLELQLRELCLGEPLCTLGLPQGGGGTWASPSRYSRSMSPSIARNSAGRPIRNSRAFRLPAWPTCACSDRVSNRPLALRVCGDVSGVLGGMLTRPVYLPPHGHRVSRATDLGGLVWKLWQSMLGRPMRAFHAFPQSCTPVLSAGRSRSQSTQPGAAIGQMC